MGQAGVACHCIRLTAVVRLFLHLFEFSANLTVACGEPKLVHLRWQRSSYRLPG